VYLSVTYGSARTPPYEWTRCPLVIAARGDREVLGRRPSGGSAQKMHLARQTIVTVEDNRPFASVRRCLTEKMKTPVELSEAI